MSAASEKILLQALGGEQVQPPPLWMMRQAGRYLPEYRALRAKAGSFLDLCFTPEFAIEATLQPIRRFGFDAAILFSDILVIPHALGQKLWFEEGRGPLLEALNGPRDLAGLAPDRLEDALAPVYETLKGLRRLLPKETALIGFAGAPWTVASYMVEGGSSRDFAKAKTWAYGDPEGFQRLIDLLVEATTRYLIRQVESGAEALQLFDSWSGVWPEPFFERWCLAPARKIVSAVKARHPEVPIILFPRGAGLYYAEFATRGGADALSLDTTLPLDWARAQLQPHVALQGNLDPILLLAGGKPLDDEIDRISMTLGAGPFVFNLGHGILPQTPIAHVERLVERVRAR